MYTHSSFSVGFEMGGKTLAVIALILTPVFTEAWREERRERQNQERRGTLHHHTKRHMLPSETEAKKRPVTSRTRDAKKKPSGHLTPLQEDDMDNDEVVSVAIGPPPIRPKYDKLVWKHLTKAHKPEETIINNINCTHKAANLVKDVLTDLGREFLTREVNEDFVFGQYVGNSMRNLTRDLRLKMQHEVLELVVKYQRLNSGEVPKSEEKSPKLAIEPKIDKKYVPQNDTEEGWPDFSNLAKIVG